MSGGASLIRVRGQPTGAFGSGIGRLGGDEHDGRNDGGGVTPMMGLLATEGRHGARGCLVVLIGRRVGFLAGSIGVFGVCDADVAVVGCVDYGYDVEGFVAGVADAAAVEVSAFERFGCGDAATAPGGEGFGVHGEGGEGGAGLGLGLGLGGGCVGGEGEGRVG